MLAHNRQQETPSAEGESFADFFRRAQSANESAAVELMRRYEPAVRLEIRLRLTDPELQRLLDPAEIYQSVLGSFVARASSGAIELDCPHELIELLLTLARNKVAIRARRHQSRVRPDYPRGRPRGGW